MLAGCATGSVFNMDSLLLSVPLVAFMRVKSAAMVRPSLGSFVLLRRRGRSGRRAFG